MVKILWFRFINKITFRKYTRIYDQHIRNKNGLLIPILLQTEDEINALKSKVSEAVEMYREVMNNNNNNYINQWHKYEFKFQPIEISFQYSYIYTIKQQFYEPYWRYILFKITPNFVLKSVVQYIFVDNRIW